jgi:hypothetical protein
MHGIGGEGGDEAARAPPPGRGGGAEADPTADTRAAPRVRSAPDQPSAVRLPRSTMGRSTQRKASELTTSVAGSASTTGGSAIPVTSSATETYW